MKKHKYIKWVTVLEARRKAIGVERDKLRELVEEAEALEDCSVRAYEAIDEAIQALSELA